MKENELGRKVHVKVFLRAFIQDTSTKTKNYYMVSISEEKGDRLFTYDWYKVNSQTYVISYEDMATGKTISLKEWRKHLHTPSKK
jgi:hypothetical protein